ncbi:MAG: hypothetical protein M1829_001137 [Trizodia sp. TS-e1964]|nr:MAG: hypothetical protein M1829_001137 [Trizodia sp. TS-e1964]
MTSTPLPLKSILKTPLAPAPAAVKASPEQKATTYTARQREIALYHAQELQTRKDMSLQILEAIEALMILPASPTADPAHPSPTEAREFLEHLALFQPSDFDDVVEERNIGEKCGYPLCPRPRHRENTTATYRILRGRKWGRSGAIVRTAELELYCSDECETRAKFVKAQLDKAPAWARERWGTEIRLPGENRVLIGDRDEDSEELGLLAISPAAELGVERGEWAGKTTHRQMNLTIREKPGSKRAIPPSLADWEEPGSAHLFIEGRTFSHIHRPLNSED